MDINRVTSHGALTRHAERRTIKKIVQTLLNIIDLLFFHIKNPPCHKA